MHRIGSTGARRIGSWMMSLGVVGACLLGGCGPSGACVYDDNGVSATPACDIRDQQSCQDLPASYRPSYAGDDVTCEELGYTDCPGSVCYLPP